MNNPIKHILYRRNSFYYAHGFRLLVISPVPASPLRYKPIRLLPNSENTIMAIAVTTVAIISLNLKVCFTPS